MSSFVPPGHPRESAPGSRGFRWPAESAWLLFGNPHRFRRRTSKGKIQDIEGFPQLTFPNFSFCIAFQNSLTSAHSN